MEFGFTESNAVDTDAIFTEKERLQMCINASKQQHLEDQDIEFLEDERTEPKKFYMLDSRSRNVIQAFKCPTDPPIYLQVCFWDYRGYVAWVILEKQKSRGLRELQKPREQSEQIESQESRQSGEIESIPPNIYKIKYVEGISEGMLYFIGSIIN